MAASRTPSSSVNGKLLSNPSLRQTMGCFLLHYYAKHMKEKAMCEIDAGINKAFSLWQDPSKKSPSTCLNGANGKGPCVPCHWNKDILESCKIDTNGTAGSTVQTEVKNKLDKVVTKDDDNIKEMAEVVNNMKLCQRAQCISERWLKSQGKGNNGKPLTKEDWKDVWTEVGKEFTELGTKISAHKEDSTVKGICTMDEKGGKDACLLIAAGLKDLYEINDNDPATASFKRTMRCVLLNAIADKMKDDLPCNVERSVKAGIEEAFKKSGDIMTAGKGCQNGNVTCFKCERVPLRNLVLCSLDSERNTQNLKKKIEDDLLKEGENTEMTKIKAQAVKDICKPCDQTNLCDKLKCIAPKWAVNKFLGSNDGTWNNMQNDFTTQLTNLLNNMKDEKNQTAAAGHCNNANWKDNDAHGAANREACKLVAAGLQHISKIQENHSTGQHTPYDNQEFKQVVSCFMLNAVVQKMKEVSKICDIDQGIRVAFLKAVDIKDTHCKNDKPCIVCKLDDKYDACSFDKNKADNVKDKLDSLLTEKGDDVNGTLKELLKTDQKDASLCSRLQCLASRVQMAHGKNSADDFWGKEGGEVANLWKELSQAMTNNGMNGGDCETMVDGTATSTTRPATDPEKKACQHLTAGFNKLKENPKNGTPTYTILKDNPLLRQTVGCLLLKEYAKKMKDKSKCVIESGIKKAFGSWGQIPNGPCTGNSPCIECKWEDTIDSCTVAAGTAGTEKIKEKVNTILPDNDGTLTTTMKDINETDSLCAKLQCAAPKWFQNQMNGTSGTPTTKKDWCDFWDTTVKGELLNMFKIIQTNGNDTSKTKHNTTCQSFGDGNPLSVERKACNHIAEGLKYISEVQGVANGGTPNSTFQADDKFFKQTMMCAALNLYATKIGDESKEKCPIDESKINEMFTNWNQNHNSPCSGSGANNNVCFKCTRQPNFSSCELSVDSSLISTTPSTQSGHNCNSNTDRDNVQDEMKKLLNEDQSNLNSIKSNITNTLSTITEMKSSFCTQLQCAIKKKLKNEVKLPNGTPPSWENIESDATKELTALLKDMNDPKKQSAAAQYCNDANVAWNTKGHTERRTNKAACLLFAAGLKHIYNQQKGHVNGPSFGQTMGCLFLKEYAKQLKQVANEEKKGYSWVHPLCDIDKGIEHAFEQSESIMNATSPCNNGTNSCFVCKQNEGYNNCHIGTDNVKQKVDKLFKDDSTKQTHMQQTLENTVCPILLTDLLTPFLPLAPVSIGLSAMAYYLWKYFGPLGKGGPRFRRSPTEIPGPSVQEQVLDHVQQDSPHEYQLVKERKPRSAPTRTKRSGRVNRRTIIEIHFEVLDECQKGDTQLNQKDFLELLVQEFMGSEFMKEEQVPKEEVLMENVPMEGVPSLASGFMV
ncbi:SICAvar, type I [Plasmodium knowlesi strain H]|nr:SICAvar, type I [Plasmodium knowlesi strain H]